MKETSGILGFDRPNDKVVDYLLSILGTNYFLFVFCRP